MILLLQLVQFASRSGTLTVDYFWDMNEVSEIVHHDKKTSEKQPWTHGWPLSSNREMLLYPNSNNSTGKLFNVMGSLGSAPHLMLAR